VGSGCAATDGLWLRCENNMHHHPGPFFRNSFSFSVDSRPMQAFRLGYRPNRLSTSSNALASLAETEVHTVFSLKIEHKLDACFLCIAFGLSLPSS
jgi:hypothetical protein